MAYDLTDERVLGIEHAARNFIMALETLFPSAKGTEHLDWYAAVQEAFTTLIAAVDALRAPDLAEALDLLAAAEGSVLTLGTPEEWQDAPFIEGWYSKRNAFLPGQGGDAAAQEAGAAERGR